ncbi:MAG: hypothetical protein DI533_08745 [Cereibacter sphaeroides]|uniref:DNA topology modulation protein FlaR n=1 Tax=Cereibacter sphaeroides TaxID=1063 RepID=A0A2W5SN53_CERSP|nr:MAG: hypothetical protein DI533_08745 [Cereibacter sphaeroides]
MTYRRIMVFGGAGSGKSTLARRLGALSGLPVIHIDPLYWQPGWVERPRSETRALATEAAMRDDWVFEGNNSETMDIRAERADLIIFLDMPRHLRIWSILRRILRYWGRSRPDMTPGCPERFDLDFLTGFVWDYEKKGRVAALDFIARWQSRRPVLHLRSRRAVKLLLADPAFLAKLAPEMP